MPLDELLARSDFVSVHVPLDSTTRRLLNAARLSLMKPSAILINTSRGEVIDQTGLVRRLVCGALAGAGLDHVSDDAIAELRGLGNVVLTPGIAWYTDESRRPNLDEIYLDITSFLAGEPRNVLTSAVRTRE